MLIFYFFYLIFSGPNLPFLLSNSAVIASPNGNGLIIIGGLIHNGLNGVTETNKLLELCGNTVKTMKWVPLEQNLQYARAFHLAIAMHL